MVFMSDVWGNDDVVQMMMIWLGKMSMMMLFR